MESQTTGLGQDMKRERDIARAVELLETMDSAGLLEAPLRAALILKFTSSVLPELGSASEASATSAP